MHRRESYERWGWVLGVMSYGIILGGLKRAAAYSTYSTVLSDVGGFALYLKVAGWGG